MRRVRWAVGAVALITAMTPLQASAGTDALQGQPDRIELPNGWQPEGITTDGRNLYVGSLVDGAIWRASTKTGAGRILAPGATGRVAAGVEYDFRRDLLWVAGADTAKIRVYDADSGRLLRTYAFASATPRFLNDLVVTRHAVYATDSFNQELAVIPFGGKHDDLSAARDGNGHHGGLPKASAAFTLPLTGDLHYVPGFNLNGIVKSHGRLLAVQSNTGLLFRINPTTGVTRTVDLGGALLANGDGLEVHGNILYVVRNDGLVAVVKLDHDVDRGEQVAELTSGDLDVPTTAALAQGSLWVVNARFLPSPTPDTPYWITRLDRFSGASSLQGAGMRAGLGATR
jgi:sugar lactone lactonase YvrE